MTTPASAPAATPTPAPQEAPRVVKKAVKSRLTKLISWLQLSVHFVPVLLLVLLGFLFVALFKSLSQQQQPFNLKFFYEHQVASWIVINNGASFHLFDLTNWKAVTILLLLTALVYKFVLRRENPVLVVDFAVFEPPESWKVTIDQFVEMMRLQKCFTQDSIDFLDRMLRQSGVGDATAWPPGIVRCLRGEPVDVSTEEARREAQVIMFDVVGSVLKKTRVSPKQVDVLIVNCSIFSPTPSLASIIINEFKMREDISSYNLSGMGCSAGLVSIELAQRLLSTATTAMTVLVVSTEMITPNMYTGNERGFLLQNTLFRCDVYRSLFQLKNIQRTQLISTDSYDCIYETEDSEGRHGVRLSKELVKTAGKALEKNLLKIATHVLPSSELLKTGFFTGLRLLAKQAKAIGINVGKVESFVPDFRRGIDHFCIHAGGRGVIDGIEKSLNLEPSHVAPSRYALKTYGNTSSSSIWYEMDYVRRFAHLKRGQRVLQVGFGSGFKCNSALWLCLNTPRKEKEATTAAATRTTTTKKEE